MLLGSPPHGDRGKGRARHCGIVNESRARGKLTGRGSASTMRTMPNQLPLDEVHRGEGAVMTDVSGCVVPAHYGDVASEYRAIKEGTGVIDRSLVGKATV